MDVVLNELLWSMYYQEQPFMMDIHTGRVVLGTNPGPQPYLSKPEDGVLHDFGIFVGQGMERPEDKLRTLPKQLLGTKEIYRKKKSQMDGFDAFQEATLSFSAKW